MGIIARTSHHIRSVMIGLIRFYQLAISPALPSSCRFYPSCSEYAAQCFHHYGFFRALLKSTWRILRCNPFSEGYFDPAVPEAEREQTKAEHELHNH